MRKDEKYPDTLSWSDSKCPARCVAIDNTQAQLSAGDGQTAVERPCLAGDLNPLVVRSIHPAGRLGARRWRWRNHQAETLQKQDGALGGASPDELTTFSLAILHVNVSARVLQAATLELAIHVDAIVQNHVLILENFVLVSVHRFTQAARRKGKSGLSPRRPYGRGEPALGSPAGSALLRLPSTLRGCKHANRVMGRSGNREIG